MLLKQVMGLDLDRGKLSNTLMLQAWSLCQFQGVRDSHSLFHGFDIVNSENGTCTGLNALAIIIKLLKTQGSDIGGNSSKVSLAGFLFTRDLSIETFSTRSQYQRGTM
jgi:hypothetical protein